jgi:hypothetical protein
VTLSVLELVQLADMFRLIVVYWVKGMKWIDNISTVNRSKLLSRYDRLLFVSQVLLAVMYIQVVIECSRPFCRSSHRLVYSNFSTHYREIEGSL